MEDNYIVYLHRNLLNSKVYVGITKQDVNKRWKNGHGYTKCKKFYNAILKYGWDNFEHVILCTTVESKAKLLEQELIKIYKEQGISYNITDGGEDNIPSMLGKHHTEEARRKISEAGRRKCKESTKRKISIANSGERNGMYGKPMRENTKIAILKAICKPVLQLDKNGNVINKFSSASEAEKYIGGKGGHIGCCCLGKRKTAYGYKWRYE